MRLWEEKLQHGQAEQREDNQVTLCAKPLTLLVTKCCPVFFLTYTLKLHLFIAIHKYYDCYIVVCMVIIDVIACYLYFLFLWLVIYGRRELNELKQLLTCNITAFL